MSEELDTLNHLRITPVGHAYLKYLRKRLDESNQTLRSATDLHSTFRAQGRALLLDELIHDIEGSQDKIQRFETRQKSQL